MAVPNHQTENRHAHSRTENYSRQAGLLRRFFSLSATRKIDSNILRTTGGSMVTSEGLVTQSWFQGKLHNFWGSYHKWLETRYGAVKNTTLGLLAVFLPEESSSNRTLRGFSSGSTPILRGCTAGTILEGFCHVC